MTPPALNLDSTIQRQPSARTTDSASQFEITVAYTPSIVDPVSRPRTHVPETQSPTLPPDFLVRRNRLSNYSWMTSRSKQSTWSSIRSSITGPSRSPKPNRSKSAATNKTLSPTTPSSAMFPPYSPGLSTIDLSELPDIHSLPMIPPPRSSARFLCRGCGKFHPPGYRHSNAEVENNLSKFALWRSSKTTQATTSRQSQSTFYHDDDDEEEEQGNSAVLRQGAVRTRAWAPGMEYP